MAIFTVCLCLLLSTAPTTVAAMRIGAIVNASARVGKEQKTAIEIAAEDFDSTATPLFLNLKDSSLNLSAAVEDLAGEWKADAVLVGTGTWTDESIVAAGTSFRPWLLRALSRPWLLRMRGNTFWDRMQCLADLVGSYSWRRVLILYEEDAGRTITANCLAVLSDALRAVGSDIERTMPFSSSDPKDVREGLTQLNRSICRVFVVIQASRELRINLFQEANELRMMTEGYVWVTVDDEVAERDSSRSTSRYEQEVVEVRDYVNTSDPSYKVFLDKFRPRFRSNYGEGEGNLDPGPHAFLAYDAMHAVAAWWPLSTGARSYRGLSGHMQVAVGDDKGRPNQLVTNGTRFTITYTNSSRHRVMGFWSEGVGFHKRDVVAVTNTASSENSSARQVFGSVYWPGGPSGVPGGWDVLHVIVPARTAFGDFVKVGGDLEDGSKNVTGFSIDVFEEAKRRLPYDLRVRYESYSGSYDCMVDMVHYSNKTNLRTYNGTDTDCRNNISSSTMRYAAAVGDITILSYRSKTVDFTVPYMQSGLSKIVRVRRHQTALLFLKPFTWKLWMTTVLASLFTGVVVWLLERNANSEEHVNHSWKQIGGGVWFAYMTFFFLQGRLHSNFAKVAIVVWLFTALVLTQCYTASLSSILTVPKLRPIEFRRNETVGCDGDAFVLDYLHKDLRYSREEIKTIGEENEYPDAFQAGTIKSAYLEYPYLRVFLSKHGDDFMVTGKSYKFAGLGFAFEKGSPFTADFSTAILEMIENGTLKKLTEKAFGDNLFGSPLKDSGENESLGLDSFWLLFVLSGGTSTVVLLCFLFQVLFAKTRRRRRIDQAIGVSPGDVDLRPRPEHAPMNADLHRSGQQKMMERRRC